MLEIHCTQFTTTSNKVYTHTHTLCMGCEGLNLNLNNPRGYFGRMLLPEIVHADRYCGRCCRFYKWRHSMHPPPLRFERILAFLFARRISHSLTVSMCIWMCICMCSNYFLFYSIRELFVTFHAITFLSHTFTCMHLFAPTNKDSTISSCWKSWKLYQGFNISKSIENFTIINIFSKKKKFDFFKYFSHFIFNYFHFCLEFLF